MSHPKININTAIPNKYTSNDHSPVYLNENNTYRSSIVSSKYNYNTNALNTSNNYNP